MRLVISFGNAELTGTYAVLVSNRTDWSAKKILETYLQRWPIETFYQDSKGHLGLDEYRMRTAAAIKKHWCLVFVAYSFLHLQCLAASPRKGRALPPRKTIGEACRQQGQALIEKLIVYAHDLLQHGQSATKVFAAIFAKQQEVPATVTAPPIAPKHNSRVRFSQGICWLVKVRPGLLNLKTDPATPLAVINPARYPHVADGDNSAV